MLGEVDISQPARLLAEPARAAMVEALLGGRALPASELARVARVSPSTASSHLHKLVAGGVLVLSRQGRHRYFELASHTVAQAVESLQSIAPRRQVNSYARSAAARRLAVARSCYDHLAGGLAVAVADLLTETGVVVGLASGENGSPEHAVIGP